MSIAKFLKDRPSLSLRGLETEADLPTKTLSHYVNGRRKLSAEHIEKLTPVLLKYGFKLVTVWLCVVPTLINY